jgi:hypothetical protein
MDRHGVRYCSDAQTTERIEELPKELAGCEALDYSDIYIDCDAASNASRCPFYRGSGAQSALSEQSRNEEESR